MIAPCFFVPWLAAGLALLAEPAKAIASAAEPDFDPATVYAVRLQPPVHVENSPDRQSQRQASSATTNSPSTGIAVRV